MKNKCIILIPAYEPDYNLIELVKNINKDDYDIIVIDDGSGNKYLDIFKECKKYAHVISYQVNKGKGYALKTGLKYIKDNYKYDYLVITMDADGQHTIEDTVRLSSLCKNERDTLIIGKRVRGWETPIKSRIGNIITSFMFKIKTGKYIYDTQTGLRVFSNELIDYMIKIDGDRFEYEMNVLLGCIKDKIPIKEVEISYIYINNNEGSHFNIFKDSYQIYKNLFRHKRK